MRVFLDCKIQLISETKRTREIRVIERKLSRCCFFDVTKSSLSGTTEIDTQTRKSDILFDFYLYEFRTFTCTFVYVKVLFRRDMSLEGISIKTGPILYNLVLGFFAVRVISTIYGIQ